MKVSGSPGGLFDGPLSDLPKWINPKAASFSGSTISLRQSGYNAIHYNGGVYTVGGVYNSTSWYTDCHRYNIDANTWNDLANLPWGNATCYSANAGIANKIFAIGGGGPKDNYIYHQVVNYNQCYDIATNTWTQRTPLPTNRYCMSFVGYGDNIYLIGGSTGGSDGVKPNDIIYNINTGVYTNMPNCPIGVSESIGVVVNNKIYINNRNGGLYAYNLGTGIWEQKTGHPKVYYMLGAIGNDIYAYSGSDGSTYCYSTITNTWSEVAVSKAKNWNLVMNDKGWGISHSADQYQPYTNVFKISD